MLAIDWIRRSTSPNQEIGEVLPSALRFRRYYYAYGISSDEPENVPVGTWLRIRPSHQGAVRIPLMESFGGTDAFTASLRTFS